MNVGIAGRLLWLTYRLRERDRWTRPQLEAHQDAALRRLREYAYARSPFYQQFHQGRFDRPLHELPVLTKAALMEHFDELVTDRAVHLRDVEAHVAGLSADRADERFLGRYWVCATAGSTGRRGLFLFDRGEWVTILASFARAHEWAGLRVSLTHRMRMASVASTAPWHMSARVAASLRSWWMPALRLDAAEPVDAIVERLNAWPPEMLVAYASMARILAEEQLAGRLRIGPHLVFTNSEVLTDDTRRRVEQAWGRRLFNQYAATETGGLAAECAQHRGMHLAEDLAIVEVVDERNRPVAPGTYGATVLVTVLASRTQPLIRYELSDSVRLAGFHADPLWGLNSPPPNPAPPVRVGALAPEPCPCGRPFALVDGIHGRMEEVLPFPAPDGRRVAVHPHVFHRVMDTVPAAGWQVVHEPAGLRILLSGVRDGFADATLIEALRRELAGQGIVVPPVTVERVAAIPRTAAGKAPLVATTPSHAESPATTAVAAGAGR